MKKVAIVGVGPRGLHALEQLYLELAKSSQPIAVHTTLFEIAEHPGAGTVWNVAQPDTNWMNISERSLRALKERPVLSYFTTSIPKFPSYSDWSRQKKDAVEATDIDSFPPRSIMGRYLNERFISLYTALKKHDLITLVKERVDNIIPSSHNITIVTETTNSYVVDDVLLAIGHQDTEMSKQLSTWSEYAQGFSKKRIYTKPYPVMHYTKRDPIDKKATVAIRGFGLAMIDVCRALTIGYGGTFHITNKDTYACIYKPSNQSIQTIIPFSLDGLPPAPKPIGKRIDHFFKPEKQTLELFQQTLAHYATGTMAADSADFFIDALANVAVSVFMSLGSKATKHDLSKLELSSHVKSWIHDQNYRHPLITDVTIGCKNIMKAQLEMALGNGTISLDYCIGQVWRHCQPIIYEELSHSKLADSVIKQIIELDEKSKRYSYGPPVKSMQQLLALVEKGVLNLDYVDDPSILTHAEGWEFRKNEACTIVHMIINSVLDAPKISAVNSILVKQLLRHDLLEPVYSDLGIDTYKDGTFLRVNKDDDGVALAMIGRLCKGSVIGVDAILECFGPRVKDWAKAAAARLVLTT